MQFAAVTTTTPQNANTTITTNIAGVRVSIDARLTGPSDPTFGLDAVTRDRSILWQFFLDQEFMPEGCTFDSDPVARFTGDVTAYSADTSFFDDPSAECVLHTRRLC